MRQIVSPMPSEYSVHLTILALTLIQVLYKSHSISNYTHLHFSAMVTTLNCPSEL